jgi:hypothetical protein
MFVYVGKSYTATLGGSRIVPVACERCQNRFFYELTRVGVGRASAPYYVGQAAAADRAEQAAKKDLARRLERESELVPCPECQWVNGDLIARYRRRRYRPLGWIAAAIAIVGIVAAMGDMFLDNRRFLSGGMQVFLAVCLLSAGAVLLFRNGLRRRIDPNRGATGKPVIPPGTPPALVARWDPEGGPVRLETVGRPAVDLARGVEWVLLRPNQVELPQLCCLCLDKATTAYDSPFKVNEDSTIDVPLCGACAAGLRHRWWIIALITFCLTLAVTGLVVLMIPAADTTGRWISFVIFGTIVSAFAIAVVPNMACRPYRFRVIDADRGIVRFSARNLEYNALLEQSVRESDGISSKLGPFRGGPEDLV